MPRLCYLILRALRISATTSLNFSVSKLSIPLMLRTSLETVWGKCVGIVNSPGANRRHRFFYQKEVRVGLLIPPWLSLR